MIRQLFKYLILKRIFKSQYKYYRKRLPYIHQQFIETINKKDMTKGAKALRIMKNGTLIFNSEEEGNVLMDYCIHNTPRIDRNYIDLALDNNPSPDDTPILNSLKDSRFSIYRIVNKKRGFGILAEDTLSGETVFIMDKALSKFGIINLHLTGRILPFTSGSEEQVQVGILSGASLPVDDNLFPSIQSSLESFQKKNKLQNFKSISPKQKSEFESLVLRKCLKAGAGEKVMFT